MKTDHLGSTDAVLGANGAVLLRGSFGVHGARRASNWQGAPSSTEWQAIANTTRRGYTGHEQLDNVLLVHMNGRVFDPQLGRFLSADPYIDGPETTQGWNRYGYVHGRALSATDPRGFAAGSALEEIFVTAERLARAAAGVFGFTAGSASAEAPETGLPVDADTGLEELLVPGARIRPGGGAAVPVTPQGQCTRASPVSAKISLGAQIGFSARGSRLVNINGEINLYSWSQSSDEYFSRDEQSFGGGASILGFGLDVASSRSVPNIGDASLSGASWDGPELSAAWESPMPGVSPELSAPGGDI